MSPGPDSHNRTLGSHLNTRAYPYPKTFPRLDIETLPKLVTRPRSHNSTLVPKHDRDMVSKPEPEPDSKTQPQPGFGNLIPTLTMDPHPNFDSRQVSKLWLWYQLDIFEVFHMFLNTII